MDCLWLGPRSIGVLTGGVPSLAKDTAHLLVLAARVKIAQNIATVL